MKHDIEQLNKRIDRIMNKLYSTTDFESLERMHKDLEFLMQSLDEVNHSATPRKAKLTLIQGGKQ